MSPGRTFLRALLPAWLAAAALPAAAQSVCSSDGLRQPAAVLERFINADCDSCWRDPATPRPGANELVLDWILPGSKGDDAPLSMGASRDGLERLQALGRKEPTQADAHRSRRVAGSHKLRVAQGIPFNDYIGTSIELKPGRGGPWRAWLLLVEVLPAGAEGSPVARNLVQLFFDRAAVKGGASRPAGVPPWKATKVGILGAGMMGAGIAHACASRGIPCVLKDVNLPRAEAGKAHARRLLEQRVKAGRMTPGRQAELLALIEPTAEAASLQGCDLVIEAVFEQRELKAQVTREAEPWLAEGGLFATNTSTLPITGLAEASAAPERFIGLHFFSPVDRMELVEIIAGAQTSAGTLARAHDFVRQIGKTPIVVRDARGFYTSRTFGTYLAEGAQMVWEGVPAAVVEQAGLAAGMAVGPLAVADEISQATVVALMEQNLADLAREGQPDRRTPGEHFIERLCKEHQRRGRVHGGGYYDYPAEGPKTLWPGLKQFEKPDAAWTLQALGERLLVRQALESLRCMAEGVVTAPHDVNIGSILGIGFPPWTGGACQYIQGMGLETFLQRCEALARMHGERFAPPALPPGWGIGSRSHERGYDPPMTRT